MTMLLTYPTHCDRSRKVVKVYARLTPRNVQVSFLATVCAAVNGRYRTRDLSWLLSVLLPSQLTQKSD